MLCLKILFFPCPYLLSLGQQESQCPSELSTFSYHTSVGLIISTPQVIFGHYSALNMRPKTTPKSPTKAVFLSAAKMPRSSQDRGAQTGSSADKNQQVSVFVLPNFLLTGGWVNTGRAADGLFNKWMVHKRIRKIIEFKMPQMPPS